MDRVSSKFQTHLWAKNECVKVAYFIMCRNRLKITPLTRRRRRRWRKREYKIVWILLYGKSASAEMSSSAQKSISFGCFLCRSRGCCCYSLHFTRDYEALIVKINYAIRQTNTLTHTHTHSYRNSNRPFCMCVCVFLPFFFQPKWYVYQVHKMARNAK